MFHDYLNFVLDKKKKFEEGGAETPRFENLSQKLIKSKICDHYSTITGFIKASTWLIFSRRSYPIFTTSRSIHIFTTLRSEHIFSTFPLDRFHNPSLPEKNKEKIAMI